MAGRRTGRFLRLACEAQVGEHEQHLGVVRLDIGVKRLDAPLASAGDQVLKQQSPDAVPSPPARDRNGHLRFPR